MPGGVDRPAHRGDVAGHAGGGLVVDHQHALDLVVGVGLQPGFDLLGGDCLAPLDVDHVDLHAVPFGAVDEQGAELAVADRQQPVAGGKGVDQRRLPPARSGGREDERLAVDGVENSFRSEQARVSSGKAEERWSSIGRSIARRTRSGMFVGPGTKRKWRPGNPLRESGWDMGEAYIEGRSAPFELLVGLYWTGVGAAAPGPALAGALGRGRTPGGRCGLWRSARRLFRWPKPRFPISPHMGWRLPAAWWSPPCRRPPGDWPRSPATTLFRDRGRSPPPRPSGGWRLAVGRRRGLGAPFGRGDEPCCRAGRGRDRSDLQSLYRALLSSGLDIARMNTVRKRFSRWGAGRLAVALQPARVRTFIVSDVVGDDLSAIGSGPCVPDESTAGGCGRSSASLEWFRRLVRLPGGVEASVVGDPQARPPGLHTAGWEIVAGNRLALEAVARRAGELG